MKSFEILPNDLIVSCSGTIGKIAIAPNDIKQGIINQALLRLRIKDNKIFSKCLKIILDNSHNPFETNSLGAGLKNVASVDTLKQIKIPLPPLNEQEKISSCIASIESKINALDSILPTLQSAKSQILQKYLLLMLNRAFTRRI